MGRPRGRGRLSGSSLLRPKERAHVGWVKSTSAVRGPIDVNDVLAGNGALVAALGIGEPRRICQVTWEQAPATQSALAS